VEEVIVAICLFIVLGISPPTSPRANSLLWKITLPSGAVSHIFGTIHLQDSTVFRQRDTVLSLVRTCYTYASELHLDSVLKMMQPSAIFLTSKTLYNLADTSEVEQICTELEKRLPGMKPICSRLKPGAIGMLIALGSTEKTAPVSIDQFLWNLAKEHQPRFVGLETLTEQIAVLDQMSTSMLLEQINQLSREDSLAQVMPGMYAMEELDAIAGIGQDTSGAYSGMMGQLNDERNVLMVTRMQDMLTKGNAFIAIGALHLTGPQSVLTLLDQRGYSVTPVMGGRRSQWLDK